jgi:transcriptional regulator with XRE-family HTH domain
MAKIEKQNLRKLRETKGLSQEQLAEMAGVNKQTISRLERGEQEKTRPRTIARLTRALGVDHAVLTGDAPIPDLAPPPAMSPTSIEMSTRTDNALWLVAQRYFVRRWQIVELAPLLFCWAAEMSLRQRRQRLSDLERACETTRSLEREMKHLPAPNLVYSEEKIAAESGSINSHDIFGMGFDDDVFSDGMPQTSGDDVDNPFARFLTSVLDDLGDVVTFGGFSPIDYPDYRVCPEEALRFASGDEQLAESILDGSVVLSAMPKEFRDLGLYNKKEERIAWMRAHVEEQRKALLDSFLVERRGADKGASA